MKKLDLVLRILAGLLMLLPAMGGLGFMPEPTADMYTTGEGYAFIKALYDTGYMMPLVGLTSLAIAILLLMNKTKLAAIIMTPLTVNIIAFHLFLDSPPINATAIPAYMLLFFNGYFLWRNKDNYKNLW